MILAGIIALWRSWLQDTREQFDMREQFDAIEADTAWELDSNEIYIPPGMTRQEWERELDEEDRQHAAAMNEVFAQEAKAHREGRRWEWARYSGLTPEDMAAMAEADGHPKPSDEEAAPWR